MERHVGIEAVLNRATPPREDWLPNGSVAGFPVSKFKEQGDRRKLWALFTTPPPP